MGRHTIADRVAHGNHSSRGFRRNKEEQTMADSTSVPASNKRPRQSEEPSKSEEQFRKAGNGILRRAGDGSEKTFQRRWRTHFGVSPLICAHIWDNLLEPETLPQGFTKERFLWGLMLLKMYNKEAANCSLAGGVDEQTWRTWAWAVVYEIAHLEPMVVCMFPLYLQLTML